MTSPSPSRRTTDPSVYERNTRELAWFAVVAASLGLGLGIGSGALALSNNGRVDRLRDQVACLQHPDHAISAVSAVRLPDGTFRESAAATVICP